MKGYPIIGGPLAGQRAVFKDFYPGGFGTPGKYAAHSREYWAYNRNTGYGPKMIWLHVPILNDANAA